MSDTEPLSALDYELFILYTMVDALCDLTEGALRCAGVDRDAMEASHQRVEEQNYVLRPAFEAVTQVLGPPLREGRREVNEQQLVVRTFPVRLWSGFTLEVYGTEDGLIWDERFVRADGVSSPRIDEPSELRAWLMTKDEVDGRFGPLQEVELWPPYAAYSFNHSAPNGAPEQKYVVTFSRSLLQSAEPAESRFTMAQKQRGNR
jgi:hypothetical protein